MEVLNITRNEDSTLTFHPPIADPVSVTNELWATLEPSQHVIIDARPAGDQGQPAVTYVYITCTNMWLSYTVRSQTTDGYVFELGGYAEL